MQSWAEAAPGPVDTPEFPALIAASPPVLIIATIATSTTASKCG